MIRRTALSRNPARFSAGDPHSLPGGRIASGDGPQTLDVLAATVRSTLHPEGFHGSGERGGFFEGWYVKLVVADRTPALGGHPGVFRVLDGEDRRRSSRCSTARPDAPGTTVHAAEFRANDGLVRRAVGRTASPPRA